MNARECYVLIDVEVCPDCQGSTLIFDDDGGQRFCACAFRGPQIKVPLIGALRALGIDVPEPEEVPAMFPP